MFTRHTTPSASTFFAALLAVGLLLPGGAAQAQTPSDPRQQCGSLGGSVGSTSTSATCSAQTYGNGIIYESWNHWGSGGFPHEVAVTVSGTSDATTTITASSSPDAAFSDDAIVVRTTGQGMGDTTSRDITLNVAAGDNDGNRVAIVGGSTATSSGIFVHQLGNAGDDTTVTIGRGVTIGGSGSPVMDHGVILDVSQTTNSGVHTLTSAAAIHSTNYGILVSNQGSGNVAVTNSGAITTAATGGNGAQKSGIRILDWSGTYGGSRTADTTTTVTNTGSITVSAANARGIEVDAEGLGLYRVVNSGTVSASGAGGRGIYIGAKEHRGAAGTDAVVVESSGDVTALGAGAHGILVESWDPAPANMDRGKGSGAIKVTTTGGTIRAGQEGILIVHNTPTARGVSIMNGASIEAGGYGVYVANGGTAGTVSIEHSGGDIAAGTQPGIHAQNAADGTGDLTISVTGGSVKSDGQSKPAVSANQLGTGGITVNIAAADGDTEAMPTLISKYNAGVYATLGMDADNNAGQIAITQGGTIAARKGVYARVGRASAEGETRAATAQPVIDVTWSGTFSHGMAGVAGGTTADVSQDDMGRYVAAPPAATATTLHAIAVHQEVETEKTIRYGSPAGIEAQVMSWRDVMSAVAAGDAPAEAAADNAAQLLLVPTGATDADNAYVAAFKAALTNPDIEVPAAVLTAIGSTATTAAGVTDAEIVTYLQGDTNNRRTLLRNVLAQSLSDEEKAVLRAVVTNTGLDAALDDADAAFSDAYKMAVKTLLERRNIGNIRVNMTGGSIASRGDGIRAYYATPNAMNGGIDVTVAEGAEVTGANAGIYVANAGAMGTGADRILKQTVTVNGMVTGGMDAAVHLAGGGTLTVGETGVLKAGAGQPAVLVNDPGRSVVTIHGTVEGGEGAAAAVDLSGGGTVTVGPMGRVNTNANGANSAFRVSGGTYQVAVYATGAALNKQVVDAAIGRVRGGFDTGTGGTVTDRDGEEGQVSYAVVEAAGDYATGFYLPLALVGGEPQTEGNDLYAMLDDCPDAEQVLQDGVCVTPMETDDGGSPQPQEPQAMLPFSCDLAMDGRCRLYEALPSTLLAMNGLPTYGERTSAARDARGGWAQVEVARGQWKADTSTRPDVAYDHRRHGVRAGMDFAVMGGDAGRVGVSVHGLRGSAEMAGVGEIDLSGAGVGVHVTRAFDGGFHVDVQAAVTWYDADLKSTNRAFLEEMPHGTLKNDLNGHGYALGVEVGQALPMDGGLTVTPRAGLLWSKADLDDFTDEIGSRVSVKDAQNLKGRAGVGVEKVLDGAGMDDGSRLFASLDVEQEFKEETEVEVSGTSLKASAWKTWFRIATGTAHVWGDGRYALQGSVGYTAGGGGNRDFGGGLSFAMRF